MLAIINKPYVWVIVFLCGWMLPSSASAQNEYNGETLFTIVEKMPEFPGGEQALAKFLQKKLIYPEQSKSEGIEGKVYVNFYVTKTGELVNINIKRGLREDLDAEALRVIRLMPKWIPGKQGGEPVHVTVNLSIEFKFN